jgi:hypothetical protein
MKPQEIQHEHELRMVLSKKYNSTPNNLYDIAQECHYIMFPIDRIKEILWDNNL